MLELALTIGLYKINKTIKIEEIIARLDRELIALKTLKIILWMKLKKISMIKNSMSRKMRSS